MQITYARSALKSLRRVDGEVARRILRAIDALADEPRPPGCLQLRGGNGELRIRVGDYRVVYDVIDEEVVVLVLRLGHRREVYR
ncbi:type II toxin-antitoxin system mRNA interferase toxin, RelE/StbE family [Pseudactinotalea sp. HY160]|nr:type II toxin-antitoxin system mRNA interferase toxin, RelE/StbE family [Pseudactinotalea sp. HY160]